MASHENDRDLGEIAFLAMELQEHWGVLSPAARKAARAAVDKGHGLAVAMIMKEMHTVTYIEHWYKSGAAKEFLSEPKRDDGKGGDLPKGGS